MRSLLAGLISISLLAGCARGRQQPHARAAGRAPQLVVVGGSVAHVAGDESGRGIAGNLVQQLNAVVSNLGINGARTKAVLRLLQTAAGTQAISDAVVLSLGIERLLHADTGSLIDVVATAPSSGILGRSAGSRVSATAQLTGCAAHSWSRRICTRC